LGEKYLRLYLTRQDSLIQAEDKYTVQIKADFHNAPNSHNFKFTRGGTGCNTFLFEMRAIFDFRLMGKIHFALLLAILLNFFAFNYFGFGLEVELVFLLKIIWYLLGVVLFFQAIKRSGRIVFYFFLFVFYPILVAGAYLLDKLMGALLASLLLIAFDYPKEVLQDGDISVFRKQDGFLAPCCGSYYITQSKFLIFQRKIDHFALGDLEEIDKLKIKIDGNRRYLSWPSISEKADSIHVIALDN
jgi:hypothetical protein